MFLLSFVLFDLIGIDIDGWITVSHISFCTTARLHAVALYCIL
jgi:hypothetical protein